MNNEIKRLPIGLSRRQVLHGACIAAGGAAVLVGSVMPAQAKMTQKAAGYQEKPNNGASCASCALFQPPNACSLVDGTISPAGWCRFYAKKS